MKRTLVLAASLLALAGCRSSGHAKATHVCDPATGSARLGVCVPRPHGFAAPSPSAVRGRIGVDVSSYQGRPNWARVRGHVAFVVAKAKEGTGWTDPDYRYNAASLARLHIPYTAYLFLRPGHCGSQGGGFARYAGSTPLPLVVDAEVPVASGCVAAAVRAVAFYSHRVVIVYTSPGTWPGGSHGGALLWVATYGSRPGCVWTCVHIAWQFTDGQFGPFPHSVFGLGAVDLDLDTGLLALLPHPKPAPKPKPHHSKRWRELHYLVRVHCGHRTHRWVRVCVTWRGELRHA